MDIVQPVMAEDVEAAKVVYLPTISGKGQTLAVRHFALIQALDIYPAEENMQTVTILVLIATRLVIGATMGQMILIASLVFQVIT